jgi:alkylated DNA repair dioxygenase AlkB
MELQLLLDANFYSDHEALFNELLASVTWDNRMAARRTASFGRPYNYSQIDYPETPIPLALLPLVDLLHARLQVQFNNCLLNHYETGDNTMGFHSDDTAGLMPGTGVAIVSLGSVRDITFRSKKQPGLEEKYSLNPGSLLYMDNVVQENWTHAIKRQEGARARISLTWRAFKE